VIRDVASIVCADNIIVVDIDSHVVLLGKRFIVAFHNGDY